MGFWIAVMLVVYVDGTVVAEADVASNRATCEEMHKEFNAYVASDHEVVKAKFRCERL